MQSCKIHRHLLHYLLALSLATALSVVILNQVFLQRSSSYLNKFNFYRNSAKCINNCEGHFNVSVWDKDVCEGTYENVAQFPKFPAYPEHHYSAENLSSVVENTEHPSIKRIQSYLRPKESGFYKFRVRASTMLRIFLETSHQSLDIIIEFSRGQNGVVYSKDYLLRSNHSYYFELLIFCHSGKNYIDVEWLVPGSAQFRAIKSRDLASGPSHVVPSQHPPLIKPLSTNQNMLLGFIPRIHIVKSFPACVSVNFRSSYVTPDTSVYTPPSPPAPWIKSLVQLIKKCLQKAVPSKYPSLKLLKVESRQSSTQSDLQRLLVDLELVVDGLNYKERMSEYFFSWNTVSSLNLCRPLRYNWDHYITLNFVYLADCYENEKVWAHYFIENMIKILETSLDVNLKVIITTCDEQEARGYDAKLRSSGFDRYAVVLLDGVYTESRGMKAALSVVEDEKSIVVRCQSRVWMPTMIVEEVRKHTFTTTMAYCPIPFQLDCGYFPGARSLDGEWCAECVALLSLYKHDWEIILTVKPEESQLRRRVATRSDSFLKDKQQLLRHISNFGIEIIQVKLNDLHRL